MCAALAYIDNNISQHITLQAVAAAAMLSPSYFSSSFKRYTGYSLIDYTNAKRVRIASKMLLNNPNTSISEIAMQVGFNNMSNFNRAFRKYIGCTPSEFISENNKPKK
jgi:YesN/AraC family two-component response regulator